MALIGISGKAQSGKDTIGKIIQYLQWKYSSPKYLYEGDTIELLKQNSMMFVPKGTRGFVSIPLESGWEIKKFADKVKEITSLLTGIPVSELEKEEVKKSNLPEEWNTYDFEIKSMSVREMLQKIGTDCMRKNLHPNTWVNALFADYKSVKMDQYYPSNWIITDVRFPNEAHAIKEKGGILIRVNRNRFRCSNCSSLVVGAWSCQNCGTDQLISEPYSFHESEIALDTYKNWDYIVDNNSSFEKLINEIDEIFTGKLWQI